MSDLKLHQLAWSAIGHYRGEEVVYIEPLAAGRMAVYSSNDQQWSGSHAEWQSALRHALEKQERILAFSDATAALASLEPDEFVRQNLFTLLVGVVATAAAIGGYEELRRLWREVPRVTRSRSVRILALFGRRVLRS